MYLPQGPRAPQWLGYVLQTEVETSFQKAPGLGEEGYIDAGAVRPPHTPTENCPFTHLFSGSLKADPEILPCLPLSNGTAKSQGIGGE